MHPHTTPAALALLSQRPAPVPPYPWWRRALGVAWLAVVVALCAVALLAWYVALGGNAP